jgi:hypothetical protein
VHSPDPHLKPDPGWWAGVEWTLLWIENKTSQLTEGRR